jgi:Mg-chelatase subunit ChlD
MENNLKRWRLILGGEESDGTGYELDGSDLAKDRALSALYDYEIREKKFEYDDPTGKSGGSGTSSPSISRWLGDIRKYFPKSVVDILQDDALKHEGLKDKLMLEPEILEQATPNIHLVATLMELGKLIPSKTKETARRVVQKVVKELMEKLEQDMIEAINGAISKSVNNPRPKYSEINWHKTILKNLKHYQVEYNTIIPQKLYGYGRKNRKSLKDIILCLDQSGSMGTSIIYSGIFGSVMASLPSVTTKMVVFDTEVVDLTQDLQDPVDLLFGVQLGGGTDINKALGYCQTLVSKPNDTILVLITDLEEWGSPQGMLAKIKEMKHQGVEVIVLLALNDEGKPHYDKSNAKAITKLGAPVFACTPDIFPELMAVAIQKGDIKQWAAQKGVVSG